MQVKNIDIKLLQTNNGQIDGLPKNPRLIKDDRFKQLVKSIQDDPEMLELRECIVYPQNEHFIVIAGNMRLQACKELNHKSIPCKVLSEETSIDKLKAYTIKDNIPYGENDLDLLSNEWNHEELLEWGLEIPNFDTKEEIEEDDYEFSDSIVTDIKHGDIFEIGDNHRLLCGDSTVIGNVERLMNGRNADMVFSDPDFSMPIDNLITCYNNSKIVSDCFGFWMCGDKQAVKLAVYDYENFSHFFIQDFKQATMISGSQAMTRHVMICKFGNRKMNNLKDGFRTIIECATLRTSKDHDKLPMAKRIELPATFIEHYTNNGDIILDLFGHSGSTMMASEQLTRICYMMEIEPKYCYAIVDRFTKKYPAIEIYKNGEKYLHNQLQEDDVSIS